MSGNGSPLQLAYFFSPDTIGASAAGANPSVLNLTVMISNPGLVAVAVTHITVEIPTGQEISGDISTATGLPGPVYDTAIPWSIAASGNTVTVRPSRGSAAPVTGPILFSLPGIQVNETPGTVYPVITEFYPPPTPKATDGSTYTLVKLPSDAPVTSFLVSPSVVTAFDAPVTLSWTCSTQGQQDSFGLRIVSTQRDDTRATSPRATAQAGLDAVIAPPTHPSPPQLNGCGTGGECYTAAQGAAGIPYGPVDQTTTFALDVFRPDGTGELVLVTTLFVTAQVAVPSVSEGSYLLASPSGQLVRAHWLTYNAVRCSVVVDGKTVLTGAPTDTYANGYPLLLGSTPSPHLIEIVAHGVDQNANATGLLGEVAVTPVAPIPIGASTGQVVVTPQGTLAFVLSGSTSVTPIDLQTTPPTACPAIQVGQGSGGIVITPNGERLLVGLNLPPSVAIVDVASLEVTGTIQTAILPATTAAMPDSTRALIANPTAETLDTGNPPCMLDIVNRQVVWTCPSSTTTVALAVTPDGSLALALDAVKGDVSVIDLVTGYAEPMPIPTGLTPLSPSWIAIAPDGQTALVFSDTAGMRLIDIPSRTVVAAGLVTGVSPMPATFTPDARLAFIPNQGSSDVTVIDLASRSVAATIPVDDNPAAVAITSDGLMAIVTLMGGSVASIDIPSLTAGSARVPISAGPYYVALDPTSLLALVACTNDNTVWVI